MSREQSPDYTMDRNYDNRTITLHVKDVDKMANIIKASPELLEALKDLLDEIPTEVWEALPQYIQNQAIKSIAKATGA